MEYVCFILAFLVVFAVAGVAILEARERHRDYKKPVFLPILGEREKRKMLDEWLAPFGFAYDSRQDIFYSRMDSWQREYGYGKLYDDAASAVNMIIDCEPIYFEYQDRKWLIEFWKGQYGITTGGEVGIYYLPIEEAENLPFAPVYHSAGNDDIMPMRMVLWKQNRQLFGRQGYHWWLTGFVLGEFSKPSELTLDVAIDFPSFAMGEAFCQGLRKAGYQEEEMRQEGRRVWVRFAKPHTTQPLTQGRIVRFIKQRENRRNCRTYRKLTGNYANAYDKLYALRVHMPELYQKIELLGKSRFLAKNGGSHDAV